MSLSIVYEAETVKGQYPTGDIVAVGLGERPESGWIHPATSTLWLRDFLPIQFPSTRILTFGYDNHIWSGSSADLSGASAKLLDELVLYRQGEAVCLIIH